MYKILCDLEHNKKITPPKFALSNCCYLVYFGSYAYGVETEQSDIDLTGITIPPTEILFPHLDGKILGFDLIEKFDQWQQNHIQANNSTTYDVTIYNIIKFFWMLTESNPNVLEMLFVSESCIHHITEVGTYIRNNREKFLSKQIYHTMKGFATAQLNIATKRVLENNSSTGPLIIKPLYHAVRLINQLEQLLETGNLNLQINKDILKEIRGGNLSYKQVLDYFNQKDLKVDTLYKASLLPNKPPREEIKSILLHSLKLAGY